jgi:hypothetical protein
VWNFYWKLCTRFDLQQADGRRQLSAVSHCLHLPNYAASCSAKQDSFDIRRGENIRRATDSIMLLTSVTRRVRKQLKQHRVTKHRGGANRNEYSHESELCA